MSGKKNRGGRAGGPSTPQAGSGKRKRKRKQDTPSHVQRMVTRLGLTFKEVKDPRASRGRRHPLAAMLTLLVLALAVGRRVLRRAEALGEDMLREGTAPEGLTRPVSDTTLDRLLGSLEPEGLEQEVHRVVHRGLELGFIRQELFARGVVSIDGKAGESARRGRRRASRAIRRRMSRGGSTGTRTHCAPVSPAARPSRCSTRSCWKASRERRGRSPSCSNGWWRSLGAISST